MRGEAEEILGRTGVIVVRWHAERDWPIEWAAPDLRQFGCSPEDLAGGALSYARLIHPGDLPRIEAELDELARSGGDLAIQELRIVCPSGETRRVEQRVGTRRDAEGRVTHFEGILLDVTGRRERESTGQPALADREIDDEAAGRRAAEQRLRESEAKYRSIVETATEGVWVIGPDTRTRFVNARMAELIGYRGEEMLGRLVTDFMLEEDWPDHWLKMERRRQGIAEEYERRLRHRNGQTVWAHVSATPTFDEEHRFGGSFAMFTDITKHRRAEEELCRLNRELRAVSDCNQVLLRATDEQSLLAEVCRIVCDEAGYRMAWVGYAEDDDARTIRPVAWAGFDSGYIAHARLSWSADIERGRGPAGIAVRSGEVVYVQDFETEPRMAVWREQALARGYRSSVALPLKDENAKVFGVLLVYASEPGAITPDELRLMRELAGDLAFGITVLRARNERTRAERSVALMSFALDHVREGAYLIDETARFQYVNEESCRSLGYTRDELLGMAIGDIDPDYPLESWSRKWNEIKAKGSATFESRHRSKDGRVFPVEIKTNYFEYDGKAYHIALVRDITGRKRADLERERLLAEVREEQSRLRVVLDTAPVGVALLLSPDGRPALFNRAAEAILGRPAGPPEMSVAERALFHDVRMPNGELFPPESLPVNRSFTGETVTGVELLIRQPAGRELNVLANSAPVRDAEGRIACVIVSFEDITPIREQERLRDEFIAAAAHELKTPVTTIKGYAELLRRWTAQERELRGPRAIETINAQANRIHRRVQEMLEVVRFRKARAVLVPERLDLGRLAEQVLERMAALTPIHRMSLHRDGPVPVEADRERIEEVLVALLDNAIESSPQGGEIEVRVWTQAGEGLVSVRDHGLGISKERQPHVFGPFYEAVPPGAAGYRGIVSLSLYLAKLTVELHRGHIWLGSEEGKGTTFSFSLPLSAGGDGGPSA